MPPGCCVREMSGVREVNLWCPRHVIVTLHCCSIMVLCFSEVGWEECGAGNTYLHLWVMVFIFWAVVGCCLHWLSFRGWCLQPGWVWHDVALPHCHWGMLVVVGSGGGDAGEVAVDGGGVG